MAALHPSDATDRFKSSITLIYSSVFFSLFIIIFHFIFIFTFVFQSEYFPQPQYGRQQQRNFFTADGTARPIDFNPRASPPKFGRSEQPHSDGATQRGTAFLFAPFVVGVIVFVFFVFFDAVPVRRTSSRSTRQSSTSCCWPQWYRFNLSTELLNFLIFNFILRYVLSTTIVVSTLLLMNLQTAKTKLPSRNCSRRFQ